MSAAELSNLNELANEQGTLSDASSESNPIPSSRSRSLSWSIIFISLAGLVAVLAVGFFAAGLYQSLWNKEVQSKVTPIADSELAKLRTEQAGRLNEYRWIDQGQERIAIPIQRAMQLTVERLKPAKAEK